MDPIQFKCHCQNAASHWIEMSPESHHRYKVECGSCCKFIKWGTDAEIHYRVKARDKVTVSQYDPDAKPTHATLDKFFE